MLDSVRLSCGWHTDTDTVSNVNQKRLKVNECVRETILVGDNGRSFKEKIIFFKISRLVVHRGILRKVSILLYQPINVN